MAISPTGPAETPTPDISDVPADRLDRLACALAASERENRMLIARQAASTEVLRTIAASPDDPQPVFEMIARRARELCGADQGAVTEYDGTLIHMRATDGYTVSAFFPRPPDLGNLHGRLVLGETLIHIRDRDATPEGSNASIAQRLGSRSLLGVPLRHEGRVIGGIVVRRSAPGGFTDDEIALVGSFADQAVIAISSATALRAQKEALEQQTATSEVLQVINANPGDTTPVFNVILERAHDICGADGGALNIFDGTNAHCVAVHGYPAAHAAQMLLRQRSPPNAIVQRMVMTGDVFQILDIQADVAHLRDAFKQDIAASGMRSGTVVPLLKDGTLVGFITAWRRSVRLFSDKEIALLENFAAQAVIAMENARLLGELQARTEELAVRNTAFSERIDQQAATIDVLKVMSASPDDTQPVFDQIVRRARELCNGRLVGLFEYDGELVHFRALCSPTSGSIAEWATENATAAAYASLWPMAPTRQSITCRAILDREIVHVHDVGAVPDVHATIQTLENQSQVSIPLLREGAAIGAITLTSAETGGFTDSQIALLQTFAEQAVIAIGSVATYRALRERTAELTRSVAELQALEEVLRAVNSSLDLETVLATIIDRAVPLAQADEGLIYEFSDAEQVFVPKAAYGMSGERVAALRERRIRIGETYLGRSAAERAPVTVDDVQTDTTTPEGRTLLQGIHAVLAVPLLREDRVVGGLVIRRRSEGAFTASTVALMQTFAAQSVLAIENARLFDQVQARTRDLNESLEQQTATADVLKLISRSVFDLDTVLDALTRSAATLAGADTGSMRVRDGGKFRVGANFGLDPAYVDFIQSLAIAPGRDNLSSRVALSLAVEHIPDNLADDELSDDLKRNSPNRSALGVPLVRNGRLEGMFTLGRKVPRAFTQREIDLVQTFADQALIAIENARLFEQVQARTRELATSLDDLRRTQDRLVQTEKLASLGALTAGIAHEIKNPLNFVNNFSALSVELLDELQEILAPQPISETARAEIDDLTTMLKGNLDKVVSHGKRADGIVRNMLLHSRESGGERRSVDLNATVDEALNLAYHGARAEKPGFNVTLERHYDPAAGTIALYPQEFTRVLLNLISNGFYAGARRKAESDDPSFEPTLAVRTQTRSDAVVISVRDNGTGIPEAVRSRIFEPFFTTKPAGEGTGLGLSLSHDIVVKQHNGSIAVESVPGAYTEFTVTLPRINTGAAP